MGREGTGWVKVALRWGRLQQTTPCLLLSSMEPGHYLLTSGHKVGPEVKRVGDNLEGVVGVGGVWMGL